MAASPISDESTVKPVIMALDEAVQTVVYRAQANRGTWALRVVQAAGRRSWGVLNKQL